VSELAVAQGAEIRVVRSEADFTELLSAGWPTMLVWDHSQATPADWPLIERLRSHPYLARLPFLLYDTSEARDTAYAAGATNLLLKASSSRVLVEAIRALRPHGAAGTALIVDDDPEARGLYRRLLAEALPGQSIREAEDGQAALACLAEEAPALVVLDLIMPGVDGFTVLETIRADRRTALVPVLVLSGKHLTLADIRRLDHAHVIVQRKGLLSDEELVQLLRKVFSSQEVLPQPTSAVVKQALLYLQENYRRRVSRAEVASDVGVSQSHLSRIFRKEMGVSPWDFLLRLRLQVATDLLRTTGGSITEIAGQTGFDDPAYFSRVFSREIGCSPQVFRRNANNKSPSPFELAP
jgi:AraC-like DNA-binding protein